MKTMRDNTGHDVPVKYVGKYDRLRDERTKRVLARFRKARSVLEAVVRDSLADIAAIQEARDTPVAEKGNFSVTSFDGLVKVAIDQAWHIELDDRVKEARDRMLGYAKRLCGKAGDDAAALLEIVEEAFAANSAGRLSVSRVMSLCRRNIQAREWTEARDMLLASLQPERGRCYIHVYARPDMQHDFEMIRLDLADCWPREEAPHA